VGGGLTQARFSTSQQILLKNKIGLLLLVSFSDPINLEGINIAK
jgi:hypothetical protein